MKWYYSIRKALNLASLLVDRLPTKEDSLFGKIVKGFSMIDAVRLAYVGEKAPLDEFAHQYDLQQVDSLLWATLFHDKKILKEYPVETIDLNEDLTLKKVKISKDEMVVFIYESINLDDVFDFFFISKNIKLDSLVSSLWKDYPNGIYVESVQQNPKFSAIKPRDFEFSPQSLEKIPLYKDKLGVCLLAVGLPGTGKTAFIREICGIDGKLLKFDHAFVREQPVDSLMFLIKTIMPRVVLFDDFDRIGMNLRSAKYLYLLEALQELNITVYLTANDPSKIDEAILRTGRIDTVIKFLPPSIEEKIWFLNQCSNLSQEVIEDISKNKTNLFTQSDMAALVKKTKEFGIKEALDQVNEIKELARKNVEYKKANSIYQDGEGDFVSNEELADLGFTEEDLEGDIEPMLADTSDYSEIVSTVELVPLSETENPKKKRKDKKENLK